MHIYYLYNFLTFFYMYSAMVLISVPVGPRPVCDSDVVEPEIPTDPIVEFFEKENNDLKAKLKSSENFRLQCLEEKMKLELDFADVVDKHNIKMDAMRVRHIFGSIITLVAIFIVLLLGLNSLDSCMLVSINVCFMRLCITFDHYSTLVLM